MFICLLPVTRFEAKLKISLQKGKIRKMLKHQYDYEYAFFHSCRCPGMFYLHEGKWRTDGIQPVEFNKNQSKIFSSGSLSSLFSFYIYETQHFSPNRVEVKGGSLIFSIQDSFPSPSLSYAYVFSFYRDCNIQTLKKFPAV